jgi:hypothetical protein
MSQEADDLIAELVQALLDEEAARGRAGDARARQAELLSNLRQQGLRLTAVAHRVSRLRGWVLSIPDRIRLAERLRKRATRNRADRSDRNAEPASHP